MANSTGLTAEQLKCMEENRQKALKIRAAKLAQAQQNAANAVSASAPASNSSSGRSNFVSHQTSSSEHTSSMSNCSSNKQPWPSSSARQVSGGLFGQPRPVVAAAAPRSAGNFTKQNKNNWKNKTTGQSSNSDVQLVLISESRFEVQTSSFDAKLNEILKQLPTRQYDAKNKHWNFQLNIYHAFLDAVGKLTHLRLEPLPKAICTVFRDAINSNVSNVGSSSSGAMQPQLAMCPGEVTANGNGNGNAVRDDVAAHVDAKVFSALMPFQLEGVEFAIRRNGRVLIGDDMGLGKTIQSIAIASYYRSEWPALVLAPSSVRFQWHAQLAKWLSLQDSDIVVINSSKEFIEYTRTFANTKPSTTGPNKAKRQRKSADDLDLDFDIADEDRDSVKPRSIASEPSFVIMSYDLLSKHEPQLVSRAFRIVICDESHNLKNAQAARTQSALKVLRVARRVVLLSGTPAMSRPEELYTQISAVEPSLFRTFTEFGRRYCAPRMTKWGWDYSGASNITELHALLRHCIMIRREKRDVLSQMPRKLREMVVLGDQMLDETRRVASRRSYAAAMKSTKNGGEARSAMLEFFHETARMKLSAVSAYLNALFDKDADRKMIIFAHHRELLDGIEKGVLVSRGVTYIRIDGSTKSSDRTAFCDTFQTRSDCHVALLSITAANCGLNLTACSLVIFAELHWNPGVLIQAEDRAYRIGQSESVNVRYLIALGTADDVVWPLIHAKLDVLSRAGLTSATRSDFRDCRSVEHDPSQRSLDSFTRKGNQKKKIKPIRQGQGQQTTLIDLVAECKNANSAKINDDEVIEIEDEDEGLDAVTSNREQQINTETEQGSASAKDVAGEFDDFAFGEELFEAICTQLID